MFEQKEYDPYLYIIYDGEFEESVKLKIKNKDKFFVDDKVTVAKNNKPWKPETSNLVRTIRIVNKCEIMNQQAVMHEGI